MLLHLIIKHDIQVDIKPGVQVLILMGYCRWCYLTHLNIKIILTTKQSILKVEIILVFNIM